MRLKKGDNVEIMNRNDDQCSWHPARILSCSSHIYHVQYYVHESNVGDVIESVLSEFVRPCPPMVEGIENCKVGDVIEVFHECAWRIAVVLNVVQRKREVRNRRKVLSTCIQCLVRLLGCSRDVNVDGSRMRLRQKWHDGKWILIGKNPAEKFYRIIPELGARARKQPQNIGPENKEKSEFRDSRIISSRSLKRASPYASSIIEAGNRHRQKLGAIRSCQNMSKKVYSINDYPGDFLGTKSARTIQEEQHDVHGNSKFKNSGSNMDGDDCSIGSCSASNPSPNNNYIPFIPLVQKQDDDDYCSDAESCIGSISKKKRNLEEVEVRIRWLELCAYRRTLEALFASGPLSWDQEAMLTNLRIVLHISNDQHLVELKQLVSTRTATKR